MDDKINSIETKLQVYENRHLEMKINPVQLVQLIWEKYWKGVDGDKLKSMECKINDCTENLHKVGVYPLDNTNLSVVIHGLHYQLDKDFQ